MRFPPAASRERALYHRAMGHGGDPSPCERSASALTRQHGDLRANSDTALDCGHPSPGQRHLALECEDAMNLDFPFHVSRFQFDGRGRTAVTSDDDHIHDMIEQLLFTNPGERVNRPDFGSGLLQLAFAPNSPELAATLQFTAQATLQRWLGDLIAVEALEVTSEEGRLSVLVHYVVRRTSEPRTTHFARKG
jgi:uncharacterized protein